MNDTKAWWQSKGIIGSGLTIVASIAGFFGFVISPEMITETAGAIMTAVTALTGLVGLIGRLKATKKIG